MNYFRYCESDHVGTEPATSAVAFIACNSVWLCQRNGVCDVGQCPHFRNFKLHCKHGRAEREMTHSETYYCCRPLLLALNQRHGSVADWKGQSSSTVQPVACLGGRIVVVRDEHCYAPYRYGECVFVRIREKHAILEGLAQRGFF